MFSDILSLTGISPREISVNVRLTYEHLSHLFINIKLPLSIH